ncbi:hypothetical protein GCM10010425_54000 [Streptomyces spororaveus]|uniref:DUF4304 domain-containing protein n=1 Tax=Streptomyces spororaveus TaxID=284039 RepID=A0ABQ3T4X3_9ACTN|nr:DUF4304 domain-containing protein [Streptomyces spororaveus]MCM9077107.1 DUF4304 domain-containing protein [Streptomyces spororaveus]GHI75060.1 hypothetical protein Sspor_06210 [Streptomyces spororaveus]
MTPLDLLVKQHVAPVMKAAGFKKSGRTFRLTASNGDQAVLGFARHNIDPDAAVFEVGYRIVPAPYWEWIDRHSAIGSARAPIAFGPAVLVGSVIPPTQAAHAPDPAMSFRERWALREDNRLACGEALATVLHEEAVPQIVHLLDRGNLLQECRHPALPVVRLVPLTRVEILLRVDDAPYEEIESLLADVQLASPHDDFITWTRQRLTARNAVQPAATRS